MMSDLESREARQDSRPFILATFFILPTLLLTPGLLSAGKIRPYNTSLETARELYKLEERLDDAKIMRDLDLVDEQIKTSDCKARWVSYSEAREEVRMLAAREKGGERLSPDVADYYDAQKIKQNEGWKDFEGCYTGRLSSFTAFIPTEIATYRAVVDLYAELSEKHSAYALNEATVLFAIEDLKRVIKETKELPAAAIGTVTKVFKDAWRVRGRDETRLRRGDKIKLLDTIRTGFRAKVRIVLNDRDEEANVGPTVINAGGMSEVTIQKYQWRLQDKEKPWYDLVLVTVRGTLRLFSKNWGSRAAFSIRSGTSLCGIRGTDVEVKYVPELDEITYKLWHGVADIKAPSGKVTLKSLQTVVVMGGVLGAVTTIESALPPS
jgi:hypothetical protein